MNYELKIMEVVTTIVSFIALVIAIIAGFAYFKDIEAALHSSKKGRQQEREEAIIKEYEQKLESQKVVYVSKIEEKENALQRERELHTKAMEELRILFEREKSTLSGVYKERIEEQERIFNERLKEQDRLYQSALTEKEKSSKEALENQQSNFNETVNKVSAQLKSVTEEMLKQRQSEFAESSKEKIEQLLNPLETTISEMRKAVTDNTTKHSELGGQLDAGLKTLLSHTTAAKVSADNLAKALRGNNRVQGQWGETVLRELLESQGLTEGTHFDTQTIITDASGNAVKTEYGNIMRPDIILHLDNDRDLIIDSKVSLANFLDYINAETEELKDVALKAHIASLNRHVEMLSKKDYSKYIKAPKTRLDYVIMFVPNTSALLLATTNKPDLWRKAMEKNVYIADEQTLYAALKIVSMTWTQIAQAQNHEKVFDLANEMLERVGQFMKKYEEIGKKLSDAAKSYDEGKKKLQEGGHSIPQTCDKLIKLGARQSKNYHSLN